MRENKAYSGNCKETGSQGIVSFLTRTPGVLRRETEAAFQSQIPYSNS